MQHTRHSNTIAFVTLLVAAWLAAWQSSAVEIESASQPAATLEPISSSVEGKTAAARIESANRSALTLTLSQEEWGLDIQADKTPFDAPSCLLEERLFADEADGRLDEFSPLTAALVAGGVDDLDSLHRYEEKAAVLADELRQSGRLTGSPRQQAEAVFEFLHGRILRGGYDLACTDLRRVLDDGRFNCVSATVLFNYLANAIGLECCGLEMPGHAMSRVSLSDGTLDVETTCPSWFHLKDDPQQQITVVAQTIGTAASADRSKARGVSPIQLAAMIYYNRGVDLLTEKRFADAARVNAKALRLDPSNATARGNLLATLNNWSIALGDSEHFADAVDLLRQGLAMDAKFEAFAQNYVHVHRQWVDYLCSEGRYAEAIDLLTRATAEMPDRDYLRKAQNEVRQRWTKAIAASSENGSANGQPAR
jgi:tetratricopeptide (TPR) repeat protein